MNTTVNQIVLRAAIAAAGITVVLGIAGVAVLALRGRGPFNLVLAVLNSSSVSSGGDFTNVIFLHLSWISSSMPFRVIAPHTGRLCSRAAPVAIAAHRLAGSNVGEL